MKQKYAVCPVCKHTLATGSANAVLHLIDCGVMTSPPIGWSCICGYNTGGFTLGGNINDKAMEHLATVDHDWPALLTMDQLKGMP